MIHTTRRAPSNAVRTILASLLVAGTTLTAQRLILQRPDPEQTMERFLAAARALPFVAEGGLAYGRELPSMFPADAVGTHRDAMQAARLAATLPDRLVEQLTNDDPRVRLMAAWGLFQLADARWLPALGAVAGDAGTIPCRAALLGALNLDEVERWHAEHPERSRTTVGREVLGWLALWGGPEPGSAGFDAWCARQQQLAPTAASLRVTLQLATRGATSSSRWEAQPLLAVLRAAQAAPRGAREIAQIALLHDKYLDLRGVYPDIEAHLEFAARRLLRDNLLRVLRGSAPVIDGEPLAAERYAGFEDGFARFVLERPERVGLVPEDADALLALGRDTGSLAFFRAAARLRPDDALPILREAIGRPLDVRVDFDRAACAILLWDLRPDDGTELLVEWFHADPEGAIRPMPTHRERFAVHLLQEYTPRDRRMFARLVLDPRFDRAPPSALQGILRTLNLTRLDPIVTQDELGSLHHPLGLDRAFADPEGARAQHPEPTGSMLATLARWRTAIRAHVSTWR